MSREKYDGGNVETNLHGDEMDNVEFDPEKERTLNRGLRTRKVNTKDRESVEAEEIYQERRSLGGYLARLKVSGTAADAKKADRMKQTTLLDLTKKPEEEMTVPPSPKVKAKKQKTLSEMFSIALQKDKPSALNALIRKTAQEVSSPSCLELNLPTPQQNHVSEKFHAHKERLKWKMMSEEEKAKIRLENRIFQRQQNGRFCNNKKQEDNNLLKSKPLPPAKPVNLQSGITLEAYSDIIMIGEFVNIFRDLLAPKESLHVSIDNLSDALVTGFKGFPLLSRILVTFLHILLQDRSTEGQELGMQLSEMPLTWQTASEVSQLYLRANLRIMTACEEDKKLTETLESLQHEEFYNLTPEEKVKIMVALCHEVLSSDALDDYMGIQRAEATELRKEKMAKHKEKKDQQKEEKERLRKEKEDLQRQKEEEENKKQLTMDDLGKRDVADLSHSCTNPEAVADTVTVKPALGNSSSTTGQKAVKENTKIESSKKEPEDVSEVVKALRQRREDMANKEELKIKEEKERLEKEEEEQWNLNMAHCNHTRRLTPIGYDRNHARYWVFSGIAAGVFVEQGWRNLEDLSQISDDSSKHTTVEEVALKSDDDDDDKVPVAFEETKDIRHVDSCKKDDIQKPSLTDVPYSWSRYETVEEVEALSRCLSNKGIRESALKKALKEQMESIAEGIRRKANKKPTKPQTEEQDFLMTFKQELKGTAERLIHGNLAILSNGLEEYQQAVDNAASVKGLASELEKLLPSVLPQFCQGTLSKDKAKQQCWVEEVQKATTVSRLHLLLGILDSTVIWGLSAENAGCKICHLKGIGKTLILCDDCNLGFHLHCLRPALSEVPEGHWSCPVCKPSQRLSNRTSVKNYKESSSESGDVDDEGSETILDDSKDSSSGDESDWHEDYCHACGEDGDLVCCDTCPLVFHTACHQPPLRNVPRGAWNCWNCRQPKNKQQKKNLRGNHSSKTKAANKKGEKVARRDAGPTRKNKRKRSRSLSSEESGHQRVSKRTRQACDKNPRDRRRRARASIQAFSDDESIAGKTGTSKNRRSGGNQAVLWNGSVLSKVRRRYLQVFDSVENSAQTVQSFYGRSTRRSCQPKVSNDKDNNSNGDSDEEAVAQVSKIGSNVGRGTRRSRRHVTAVDAEGDDENYLVEEKENRRTSQRKKGSPPKTQGNSAQGSTRNQRWLSAPSEKSDNSGEDESRYSNQDSSRKFRRSKKDLSSFDESEEGGINTSSASKSRALRERFSEPNKSSGKGKTQGRGNKSRHEESSEAEDGKEKSARGERKKNGVKKSSATENRPARKSTRHGVPQGDKKEKRRCANIEMASCEQILKDLVLHEDSWPFRQAVKRREVPDYLELIKTPMDLGTIRDKLKNVEYPDAESFVADVRLVFANCDRYNLDTSEVGQAGKRLEKHFNKLFKQSFSQRDKKSKVQRKR